MANLRSMSVDELLKLRDDISATLARKGKELQDQMQRLGMSASIRGRASLKGIKVEPKYRGPNGETWAGRGATPKWLTALMKEGHKRDEFLISNAGEAAGSRKRSSVKRSKRKRK